MALAVAAPGGALAQQEPIIAVDITTIAVDAATGSVISVALTSGGSGYINPPQVTVSGDGFGAEVVAKVTGGVVTALTITKGGSGYTTRPTISIAPPPVTPASVSAQVINGQVSIVPGSLLGGSGYTSAPIVTITGDGPITTPAAATATVAGGVVTDITFTNRGAGYLNANISIAAPVPAVATAVVEGLGTLFPNPEQNESHGPVGAFFNMVAEARGLFPVAGYTYQFFVNGVALGSSVNPQPPGGGPGIIGWAPPQPGAYILTVVASGASHTATSLPIRYFVTGTAMIGPMDNTIVPNGSSVVVQATATPPPSTPSATAFVSKVEFYVDGALAATDNTYPYSFIYTPAPSPMTHEIEARGYTNNGQLISPPGQTIAKRRVHMVTPTGTPPLVRIVNPPNEGNVQSGSAVNLIADAVAQPDGFIRKVDFYVNGVALSTSTTFPFTASWTPQVPGRYEFVAVGFDDKSNAVASTPIMLTATGSFPTVSIVDPASNGFTLVQGSTLPVTVRAAGPDGGIVSLRSIEFLVNGTVNDSLPKGPGTPTPGPGGTTTTTPAILAEPFVFNWRSNVPIGVHRLSARVTSANNLTITSPEITVNVVPNQRPQIALTSPTATTAIAMNTATTLTAASTDIDGTIELVEFYVNGVRIGSATKSPFEVTWTPTNAGSFDLTAKATDDGGASTTSEAVTVVVDPPAAAGQTTTVAHTVYRGDYGSLAENGKFAFALNRNNRGTLIAYSTAPAGRTYLWTDITVNADGTFSVPDSNNQGALTGQTSLTGVSGTFGGRTFIGPVTSSTGTFTPLLVSGTLTGAPASRLIAIVGGDGSVTVHASSGANREVGSAFLTNTGTYSFTAPTGGRFSGNVASSAALVSGSVSGTVTGNFLLRQQASRISNISTRSMAGAGDGTLVAGFVISGTGTKPLLVRAVGPTLANFGIAN
ncbi:MAG: Ig-like domain-containing protein, partial [Opitutaceae bacterium]